MLELHDLHVHFDVSKRRGEKTIVRAIPFIIAGAFLFPAAVSAFSIKEGKYSARYQKAPTPVGAGG